MIEREHAELMAEIAENFTLVRGMADQPDKTR
jgi:hypothetical protein